MNASRKTSKDNDDDDDHSLRRSHHGADERSRDYDDDNDSLSSSSSEESGDDDDDEFSIDIESNPNKVSRRFGSGMSDSMNSLSAASLSRRPSSNGSDFDNSNENGSPSNAAESSRTQIHGRRRLLVSRLRRGMAMLFLMMASSASYGVYVWTRGIQVEKFESHFLDLSEKLVQTFQQKLLNNLLIMQSLSVATTSTVLHDDSLTSPLAENNDTQTTTTTTTTKWPFVTIQDYYYYAESILAVSNSISVDFSVVVSSKHRQAWQNYTENNIGWYEKVSNLQPPKQIQLNLARKLQHQDESLTKPPTTTNANSDRRPQSFEATTLTNQERRQSQPVPSRRTSSSQIDYTNQIYRYDENLGRSFAEDNDNFYLPSWQVFPLSSRTINYNQLSRDLVRDGILASIQQKEALFEDLQSGPNDITSSQEEYYNTLHVNATQDDYPLSNLYYPILDDFTNSSNVVAMLSLTMSWKRTLSNILPPDEPPIIAVIESTCDRTYSYVINGDQVSFIGSGYVHNKNEYGSLVTSVGFASAINNNSGQQVVSLSEEYCPYTLHIYPSPDFEDEYVNFFPILYAVLIVFIAIIIATLSLFYDKVVQKRIRRLLDFSKASVAIVTSVLPDTVQKRLQLQQEESRNRNLAIDPTELKRKKKKRKRKRSKKIKRKVSGTPRVTHAAMLLERSQQTDDSLKATAQTSTASIAASDTTSSMQEQPLADLFPNCTIFFGYIHGFSSWNVGRSPHDVFTLLENVFQALDKLAKRYNIFKVETIGNCYVAATGLPDPQEDHALLMAKFAKASMSTFTRVVTNLDPLLGGTLDMKLRIGIHSGPVTAGIMGGQMTRFQLFGDTVNTASRVATTGVQNKVHLSQTTAQIIINSGKEHWITPRQDAVNAKGKGLLKTYWLVIMQPRNRSLDTAATFSSNTKNNNDDADDHNNPPIQGISGNDAISNLTLNSNVPITGFQGRRNLTNTPRSFRLVRQQEQAFGMGRSLRLPRHIEIDDEDNSEPFVDARAKANNNISTSPGKRFTLKGNGTINNNDDSDESSEVESQDDDITAKSTRSEPDGVEEDYV